MKLFKYIESIKKSGNPDCNSDLFSMYEIWAIQFHSNNAMGYCICLSQENLLTPLVLIYFDKDNITKEWADELKHKKEYWQKILVFEIEQCEKLLVKNYQNVRKD